MWMATGEIYTISVDGELAQLTDNAAQDLAPDWSPGEEEVDQPVSHQAAQDLDFGGCSFSTAGQ